MFILLKVTMLVYIADEDVWPVGFPNSEESRKALVRELGETSSVVAQYSL